MVLHERITRFVAEMKGKFSTFGPAACKPTQEASVNNVGNFPGFLCVQMDFMRTIENTAKCNNINHV